MPKQYPITKPSESIQIYLSSSKIPFEFIFFILNLDLTAIKLFFNIILHSLCRISILYHKRQPLYFDQNVLWHSQHYTFKED